MDNNKMFLLRSYSRLTMSSTSSIECCSASGLEKLYPRTSTPYPDDRHVTVDKELLAPYGIFRRILENPPKKARVRGMKNVPCHFITGHLVKMNKNDRCDLSSISLNLTDADKVKKCSIKSKFAAMKKILKNFFKKCYKTLVYDKCDYSLCPPTCECQKVKSLLNKTISLDLEK